MSIEAKTRNSSIELLRIISIICVIFLHYNHADIGGGFYYAQPGSLNYYYLQLTESFSICAVDLMIMVSAYFLSASQERRLIKVIDLMLQLILFRLAFYFMYVIAGTPFTMEAFISNLLPKNYFVILYCTLYIISPYINAACNNLSKENFKKLLITALLLFSVYSFAIDLLEMRVNTSQLSSVGMYGSQQGYTIVNFVLVYLVGAYIRRVGLNLSKGKALLGFVICLAVMYAAALMGIGLFLNYNNPVVILMAAFILEIFTKLDLRSKLINELAKAVFTCFLFHTPFLSYLFIGYAASASLPVLVVHQLGSAVLLLLISYVVYRVYKLCSGWFFRLIGPAVGKINISVTD